MMANRTLKRAEVIAAMRRGACLHAHYRDGHAYHSFMLHSDGAPTRRVHALTAEHLNQAGVLVVDEGASTAGAFDVFRLAKTDSGTPGGKALRQMLLEIDGE